VACLFVATRLQVGRTSTMCCTTGTAVIVSRKAATSAPAVERETRVCSKYALACSSRVGLGDGVGTDWLVCSGKSLLFTFLQFV
jgi:hypothetical protein